MNYLLLSLPTVAENLALDEALLDAAESANAPCESLRVWESPSPAVVLGRASRCAEEANLPACAAEGVTVIRRDSGGTAVVIGPGCTMFSLVLSYELRPELRHIDQAHRLVLERHSRALGKLGFPISCAGDSDLVWAEGDAHQWRKISGNSLRCRSTHCLYHGTFLLPDFDGACLSRWLRVPPRQPDYRNGRTHTEFVRTLAIDRQQLNEALRQAWQAQPRETSWPRERVAQLVANRYSQPGWNFDR